MMHAVIPQPDPYLRNGCHRLSSRTHVGGPRHSTYVRAVTVKLRQRKSDFCGIADGKKALVHHDGGVLHAFTLDDAEQRYGAARMQADAVMRCGSAKPGDIVAAVDC